MSDHPKVFYFTQFLSSFGFGSIIPVYALYFRHYNLNLFQIALMASIFEASILIFELPTGILADIYGRKISVALSALTLFISGLAFITFPTILGFIIAEIIIGLGETLKSGALEAWLVDSLKHQGMEDKVKYVFSHGKRYQASGNLLGLILGGYLGSWNIKYMWYPFALSFLICLVFLLFAMKEDYQLEKLLSHRWIDHFQGTIKKSFEVIKTKKIIFALILLGIFFNFSFETISQYWQIHFSENLAIKTCYFGWIVAISSILVILFVNNITRLSEKFKNQTTFLIILKFGFFLSLLIIALTSNPLLAIIFFILLQSLESFSDPIFLDIFNQHIPSEQRATLLSFRSLSNSAGEVLAGLCIGIIAEKSGLRPTFGLGSFVLALGIIVFFFLIKREKKTIASV
jgi:MFS family permease